MLPASNLEAPTNINMFRLTYRMYAYLVAYCVQLYEFYSVDYICMSQIFITQYFQSQHAYNLVFMLQVLPYFL